MPEEFQTGHEAYGGTSSVRRPGALSLDYQQAWSIGPDNVSDTSRGLLHRVWKVRVDNVLGKVYLQRAAAPIGAPQAGWDPEVALFNFTITEIDEIDLAFDQNGGVVVGAQRAGNQIWLYWFSPLAGHYVFEEIGEGRTPRLLLDNPSDLSNSDVLLFYVNDAVGLPQWRTQAELYATPHDMPLDRWFDVETGTPAVVTDAVDLFIEEAAKSIGGRLQVFATHRDAAGAYRLIVLETVPYPVPQREELYPTQEIETADAIEYVKAADWQREDLYPTQQIATLDAIELLILVSPSGPEGFITAEELLPEQRLTTVLVEDLIFIYSATAERLAPKQRVQTALVSTSVIVAPALDQEKLSPAQRVQTITVSAA